MTKTRTQKEVDQTLDVLSEIETVPSNPFLLTKIKERLQGEKHPIKRTGFYISWQLVATALLLVLNTWIFVAQATGYDATIEALRSDYLVHEEAIYE